MAQIGVMLSFQKTIKIAFLCLCIFVYTASQEVFLIQIVPLHVSDLQISKFIFAYKHCSESEQDLMQGDGKSAFCKAHKRKLYQLLRMKKKIINNQADLMSVSYYELPFLPIPQSPVLLRTDSLFPNTLPKTSLYIIIREISHDQKRLWV